MEVKRIEEKCVIENLEPIWKNRFLEKSEKIRGTISSEPNKIVEIEYLKHKDVEYFYFKNTEDLITKVCDKPGPSFHKIHLKDSGNTEILQASDKGYNLIAMNIGDHVQDAVVYDNNGNIVAQISCSRREKNRLLGMKVVQDKVELYAESKSSAGDKYYYKITFHSKLMFGEQPEHYNLSAL